jgi:hypothetical protein
MSEKIGNINQLFLKEKSKNKRLDDFRISGADIGR